MPRRRGPKANKYQLREILKTADSSSYMKGHIPVAWFVARARLGESLKVMPPSASFVVTGDNSALTASASASLAARA
jgi:hypothetical protein